ncbi:MAG: hypothetical protein COA57_11640 [Flavobacteriales bacterium]|nr:MAG: hypothetical protein COA57_11640 [Flavobacteriales bacterium]
MKRLLSAISLCFIVVSVWSQPAKVVSAYNYLRNGDLDKAQESIEPATLHVKTMNNAKTWFYRGKIYYAIGVSKEEKNKALHPDPLGESYTSLMKAFEFDAKKIDINELNQMLGALIPSLFQQGVQKYNEKDFGKALAKFENCIAIGEKLGMVDTLSIYNAALAADRGNENDKAIQYFNKCIEVNYGGAKVYSNVADVYKKQGKEQEAMDFIKKGREKYPNNQDLITAEINFFLKNENYEEALGNLDVAIQNDPENATYYFARGTILDQNGEFDRAEADYLKAIEKDADFFDALYNLGALYFNKGAEVWNQANDLPLKEAKKATEMRTEAEDLFNNALPHLEKGHRLSPSDKSTMISLKSIYARTGQTEKYNEINDKLNN